MTKEEKAIYDKEYREKNKEKRKQQQKDWRDKNKEKLKQQNKEYRELNKEHLEEYRQTEAGKKSTRIGKWKHRGVTLQFHQDWDSVYKSYIECEYCDECEVKFKNSKNRHLDHCHETGYIRNIICCRCNRLRGIEDAKNLIL